MSGLLRYSFEEITPSVEPQPKLRSIGLSSCQQVGPLVYVVGELGGGTDTPTVAVYDFQLNTWRRASDHGDDLPPLCCHASFVVDDRLYLHGGRTTSFEPSIELYSLDLITLEWTKCKTSLDRPMARFWHTGEFLERLNSFVTFGGYSNVCTFNDVWNLRVDTLQWKSAKTKGVSPTSRNGHSSCVVGETMYIFGGRSDREYTDDLHLLHCGKLGFSWSNVFKNLGFRRCFASLTYWKGQLLLFGGFDESARDSTKVYVLTPPQYVPCEALRNGGADPMGYRCYGHTMVTTATGLYMFDGSRASCNPFKMHLVDEVDHQ